MPAVLALEKCAACPQACVPCWVCGSVWLQAENDPIAPCRAIPFQALADNPNTTLVTTPAGGHLGWVAGPGVPFGT